MALPGRLAAMLSRHALVDLSTKTATSKPQREYEQSGVALGSARVQTCSQSRVQYMASDDL